MRPAIRTGLRPNPHAIGQRLGEELVLIHLHTNNMYELNCTAARIWELMSEGRDLAQMRKDLREEFDVDGVDLDAQITEFLSELETEKLVVSPEISHQVPSRR